MIDEHSILIEPVSKRAQKRKGANKFFSNGIISAGIMIVAALLAVITANTDAYESVHHFLELDIGFGVGGFDLYMTIEEFINDFLMALFFLLVGVELKYEMTVGELKNPRQAALPMVAALGGVAVPALIYVFFTRNGAYVGGWAIPMATDIAFAMGVLALLGNKIPAGVKVFFTTLAIADDIVAIIAIALFYGGAVNFMWLEIAAGAVVVMLIMRAAGIFAVRWYAVVGLLLWYAMFSSGVHATLAGVIFAFCVPTKTDIKLSNLVPWAREKLVITDTKLDTGDLILGQHEAAASVRQLEAVVHRVTPPLQRIEHGLFVPVNFLILPIFAFANAQVRLVGVSLSELLTSDVTQGVFIGMVVGKPIGIFLATFLMVVLGIAKLPKRVHWDHIFGVGLLGGIGFTMSILLAGLAFPGSEAAMMDSKFAILTGSATAAVIGLLFFVVDVRVTKNRTEAEREAEEAELNAKTVTSDDVTVRDMD